jgi:chromosome segregation ATPase
MSSSQVDADDDEARDEAAAYLQDLKDRLQKAEHDAEERQKQIDVLRSRLDDALQEQSKLEERAHEEEERVEALENEKRELTRQHRELEQIYEAERAQTMKEKEATQAREEELQETIQRLKETMAMKNVQSDSEEGNVSRTCKYSTAPPNDISANMSQRVSATIPPEAAPRTTWRALAHLPHRLLFSGATPGTIPSSSTRRTKSSKA